MKTLRNTIAAAFACCAFAAGSVLAHTQLSSSVPANEAVVETAPEEIALSFSEDVRLTAVTVESESASHRLELQSADPASDFIVPLPELAPGDYVIQWRALSQDTHVMTGEIRFTVAS